MSENAAAACRLGAPGIDLNFGCPAKTVNRHDGGAALLVKPERLYEVTSAVRAAVPEGIPVTAKVRLGFEDKSYHREIAEAVERGGAAQVVVHARTKREMYTPPAHWEYIAWMREGRTIPFVANGDIWSVEDYYRCVEVSGVSAVALGRGLVRRPQLALEIRAACAQRAGLTPKPVEFDALRFLQRFFHNSVDFRGEAYAVARLKQVLRYWNTKDSVYETWFNRAKVLHDRGSMQALLASLSVEDTWHPFKFTRGPTAPIASARRIF
jgi:tRNA-dihydrouridine synthase C